MNTKSLLATLFVLGSSTAALAKPAQKRVVVKEKANRTVVTVRDHRAAPQPQIRYHRDHDRFDGRWGHGPVVAPPVIVTPPPATPTWGWITLSQPMTGSEQLAVGKARGRFTQLQLVANRGATYVSQVMIQFGNGKYQTVAVNRTLGAGSPLSIDLKGNKGRAITRIIVQGWSGFGASYSILAA